MTMHMLPVYYTTTNTRKRKNKNKSKSLIAAEKEHEKFLQRIKSNKDVGVGTQGGLINLSAADYRSREGSIPSASTNSRGLAQPGSASALEHTLKNTSLINKNKQAEDDMRHSKIKCEKCDREIGSNNWTKHSKTCEGKKTCPVCSKKFVGSGTTCSYSCSNTYFRSGENNPNWKQDRYQSTCFEYHERRCVVCGEDKILAVHHLNENHSDNRAENLIPLCPTHHQYFHSRYKDEVYPIIEEYITEWKRGLAQSGRAGALGASGRWFNSSIPDQSYRSDQSFYHPSMAKKEAKVYNGERKLLGIATMHKSNMVPVFDKESAEDIAKMRRG